MSYEESLGSTEPLLGAVYDQVSYSGKLERRKSQEATQAQGLQVSDKYNLAYWILYLEGIGMLLPWNFFITAHSYFMAKFHSNVGIAQNFESAFSVGSMIPNVLSLFLNVFLTKRIQRNIRLITSLTMTFLCLLVTTVFVRIDTSKWTESFFAITIITIVMVNISGSITQSSFFGLGGILGIRYTQALMGGQGVAGIFAAVASILSLLVGKDPQVSALAYFLSAVVVLLASLFAYFALLRLNFIKVRLHEVEYNMKQTSVNKSGVSAEREDDRSSKTSTPYWSIFKSIYRMALSASIIFFVTLSVFPSVCSRIQSVHIADGGRWAKDFFTPVVCFLSFNVCDFIGRTIAGVVQYPGHKGPWLPLLCFSRLIFLPLFALCNFQPRHHPSTVIFNHDVYPIVIMILFGLTNGYFASLCMMYGPRLVDDEHAEVAGTMMVFFLILGLAIGAGFSFVICNLI